MKRFFGLFLVVILLTSLLVPSALAASFSTGALSKGEASNSSSVTKTTGNGVSATGKTTNMTNNATFHFRVWKNSSWKASEGKRISGIKSFSLKTLYDGYGNPRLWNGTSYYLASTHSSTSNVSSASCSGTWAP